MGGGSRGPRRPRALAANIVPDQPPGSTHGATRRGRRWVDMRWVRVCSTGGERGLGVDRDQPEVSAPTDQHRPPPSGLGVTPEFPAQAGGNCACQSQSVGGGGLWALGGPRTLRAVACGVHPQTQLVLAASVVRCCLPRSGVWAVRAQAQGTVTTIVQPVNPKVAMSPRGVHPPSL